MSPHQNCLFLYSSSLLRLNRFPVSLSKCHQTKVKPEKKYILSPSQDKGTIELSNCKNYHSPVGKYDFVAINLWILAFHPKMLLCCCFDSTNNNKSRFLLRNSFIHLGEQNNNKRSIFVVVSFYTENLYRKAKNKTKFKDKFKQVSVVRLKQHLPR